MLGSQRNQYLGEFAGGFIPGGKDLGSLLKGIGLGDQIGKGKLALFKHFDHRRENA